MIRAFLLCLQAADEAGQHMVYIPRRDNRTIYHEVRLKVRMAGGSIGERRTPLSQHGLPSFHG